MQYWMLVISGPSDNTAVKAGMIQVKVCEQEPETQPPSLASFKMVCGKVGNKKSSLSSGLKRCFQTERMLPCGKHDPRSYMY